MPHSFFCSSPSQLLVSNWRPNRSGSRSTRFVHVGNDLLPMSTSEKCPVDHSSASTSQNKCPVDHNARATSWSNLLPKTRSYPSPSESSLSSQRQTSSIPKANDEHWVYPSEAQFFAAM